MRARKVALHRVTQPIAVLRQKLLFLFIQIGEMQHVRALQATAAGQEDQSMAESNTVRRSHSVGAACGVRVAESPFG